MDDPVGRQRKLDVIPPLLHYSPTPVKHGGSSRQAIIQTLKFKSALAANKAPLHLGHPDLNYRLEYFSNNAIV